MGIHTDGIDLKYRPTTYFWAQERGIALLSDIKGAERRRIYAKALEDGKKTCYPKGSPKRCLAKRIGRCLGEFILHSWEVSICPREIARKLRLRESRLLRPRRM